MTITPFDRFRIWLIRLIAGRDVIILNALFEADNIQGCGRQKVFVNRSKSATPMNVNIDRTRPEWWTEQPQP
jgi:hypothetical protein